MTVVNHHSDKYNSRNCKIDNLSKNGRDWQDKSRKIYLCYNRLVCDKTHPGAGKGGGKKLPEEEASVNKNRIRNIVRRHFCEIAEEYGKNNHCHDRLKNCPCRAESCLFIPNLKISPREEIEEFFVCPNFSKVVPTEKLFRFYYCCLHKIRIIESVYFTLFAVFFPVKTGFNFITGAGCK